MSIDSDNNRFDDHVFANSFSGRTPDLELLDGGEVTGAIVC
jgi:hypothetical protein